MDELRIGSTPLRRYKCRCGSEGCICSADPINPNDSGTEISLADLCMRLEGTIGTPGTLLEESFRRTGGTSELRDKLSHVALPCGCSGSNKKSDGKSNNNNTTGHCGKNC